MLKCCSEAHPSQHSRAEGVAMDLRVDPADVRRASKRYTEVADDLNKPKACSQPASGQIGHIEITDWLSNLLDDLTDARQALAADTKKLARSLGAATAAIQEADQAAGDHASDIERGIRGSDGGQRVPLPAVWGGRSSSESNDLLGHFDGNSPAPKAEPMPAEWTDGGSASGARPVRTDGSAS
ncbi:type VII secretion target [Nocardioides sp. NPDC047086]|uniref:type VII secretion target n=1 Tax=Nocardioides sp. NPDC047086 TaxID=3154810 RepID=UPI00340B70C3